MITDNLVTFAGLPVDDYVEGMTNFNPSSTAYRIRVDWDDKISWSSKADAYLSQPGVEKTIALVVGRPAEGPDDESAAIVVETLVAARSRLPNLKGVFVGDMHSEECEISWIIQTDMSPLFAAYPELEYFGVRGGDNLSLGKLRHAHLKSLVVEAGGLPRNVVREVCSAELPELEHLEVWLGTPDYGGDTEIEDLDAILSGKLFPKLKYFGLKNTVLADVLAEQYLTAPILDRIEVLDLSMSTLTDAGVQKLIDNPRVKRLKKLDVHFNFATEGMLQKLAGLGIEVDTSDIQDADEFDGRIYRYVACAE